MIKSLLVAAALVVLTGCAGSPLSNAVQGRGFHCTMDTCTATPATASRDMSIAIQSAHSNQKQAEYAKQEAADFAKAQERAKIFLAQKQAEYARQEAADRLAAAEVDRKRREYEASLSPAPKKLGHLPPNYKQLIYEWANMNLKDPYSAKYTFGEWYSGYISQVAPKPSVPIAVVFLFINSKNSYGAYGGQQIYRCAISSAPATAVCFDHTPSHWKFDERTFHKL